MPAQPPGVVFCELGNIPSDWLRDQQSLTIMLKDGYTFFKANRDVFAERFADQSKTTIILINNPDTKFIEAITDKDYNKTPDSQRNDCMQTILLMQDIAKELKGAGHLCNATFAGFDDVATENIFLGDQTFFKKFYPTESYRGALEGCIVDADQGGQARLLYERARNTCLALLYGQRITAGDEVTYRPAAVDLWTYKVPENKLRDIRDLGAKIPKRAQIMFP